MPRVLSTVTVTVTVQDGESSLSSELSGDRRKLLTTDRTGSVSVSEGGDREGRGRRGTDTVNVCTR